MRSKKNISKTTMTMTMFMKCQNYYIAPIGAVAFVIVDLLSLHRITVLAVLVTLAVKIEDVAAVVVAAAFAIPRWQLSSSWLKTDM